MLEQYCLRLFKIPLPNQMQRDFQHPSNYIVRLASTIVIYECTHIVRIIHRENHKYFSNNLQL